MKKKHLEANVNDTERKWLCKELLFITREAEARLRENFRDTRILGRAIELWNNPNTCAPGKNMQPLLT